MQVDLFTYSLHRCIPIYTRWVSIEKTLGTFTVRKTGNSLSLTIPKELGVVSEDIYMLTENDGTLVYTPQKNDNPWTSGEYDYYNFKKDLEEVENSGINYSVGKERLV